jgi:hypothetical protein
VCRPRTASLAATFAGRSGSNKADPSPRPAARKSSASGFAVDSLQEGDGFERVIGDALRSRTEGRQTTEGGHCCRLAKPHARACCPLDDLSRFFEPTHMRISGREKAVRHHPIG